MRIGAACLYDFHSLTLYMKSMRRYLFFWYQPSQKHRPGSQDSQITAMGPALSAQKVYGRIGRDPYLKALPFPCGNW